jgi:hypothetical protein
MAGDWLRQEGKTREAMKSARQGTRSHDAPRGRCHELFETLEGGRKSVSRAAGMRHGSWGVKHLRHSSC